MISKCKVSLILALASTMLYLLPASAAEKDEFPLRWRYPDVKTLSTEQFDRMFADVVVVDSRTPFEWETMRVNGALNVPVDEVDTGTNRTFEKGIQKAFQATPHAKIVFYCNGKTCPKSYEAARRAQRVGLNNVYAYDAGIFDWAKAHPERTTLYTKTPIQTSDLIAPNELKAHTLSASEFRAKADAEPCRCIILDIRDLGQRDFLLFPMRETRVDLSRRALLDSVIERAKRENKTLLVYDAVGKQVMWFQYYLVQHQVKDYYFMQHGEAGYVASIK